MSSTPPEVAAELIEILKDETAGMDDLGRRIVANRLAEVITPWLPTPARPEAADPRDSPMSDTEAKAHGQTQTMRFGKYEGRRIDDVPLDYLIWLADESRRLWKEMHRYLNSPRIKKERAQKGL